MRHTRKQHGILAATLVLVAASGLGHADTLVLAIDEPDYATWEAALSAARAQAQEMGWEPTDEGVSARDLAQCLRSGDDACVRQQVAQAPAEVILILSLLHTKDAEGEPRVELQGRLLDRTGKELIGDQRFCDRCVSLDRLTPLVAELVTAILRERGAQLAPDTFIEIHTSPEQAKVTIDGVVLGPSGTSYAVAPGPHTVGLEKEGFHSATKQVLVAPNETKILRVELLPVVVERPKPPGRYRVWKWASLGAGAAAVALGTTWIIMAKPDIEDGAEQPQSRGGRTPGFVAVGAGAALLTAGVLMWRADRKNAHATLSASFRDDGMQVFVTGRF